MNLKPVKHCFLPLVLTLALVLPTRSFAVGSILISDAWARATAVVDGTGVVYVSMIDLATPDRLIRVSTPIATSAGLYKSELVDGIMHMRPVPSLPITQDAPLNLTPDGYHIMLIGLQKNLEEGQHFPLTLTFEKSGELHANVLIRQADYVDPIANMK